MGRIQLAAVMLSLVVCAPLAAQATIVEYALPKDVPGDPWLMVAGPDGNIWFADGSARAICRMTPQGAITDYPSIDASSLAVGADGGIWFTANNQIGRLDPYTGEIDDSVLPLPDPYQSPRMISGPDGNLWLSAGQQRLTRVSLSGTVQHFPTPGSYPDALTAGPDGNIWYTDPTSNAIGRMTTSGVLTTFALETVGSSPLYPRFIAPGPDGNLWFTTDWSLLGRITPAGAITMQEVPGSLLGRITTGPDGNLWIGSYQYLKVVDTSFHLLATHTLTGQARISAVVKGADGNVWATSPDTHVVARVTPQGGITEIGTLTRGGDPFDVVRGPDGRMWFTETASNRIGAINPAGVISEYPLPFAGAQPKGITTGTDGALWFVESGLNKVGRITTDGAITESALTPGCGPTDIVQGPDGNFWITCTLSSRIARMTPGGSLTELRLATTDRPTQIVSGPDGKLWFTRNTPYFGRIGTGGDISSVYTWTNYAALDLTAGADGKIWYVDGRKLFSITTDGVSTAYDLPAGTQRIAADPGGAIWMSSSLFIDLKDSSSILRFTPGTGALRFAINPGALPAGLAAGPDGSLWFAESASSRIGRVVASFAAIPLDACLLDGQVSGPVAKFADLSGLGSPGHYSATIDWGDGTAVQAGTIATDANWVYVNGTHTYVTAAAAHATVRITDLRAGDTGTAVTTYRRALDKTITVNAAMCPGALVTASVPSAGPGATYQWEVTGAAFEATGNQVQFRLPNNPRTSLTIQVTIRKDGFCDSVGTRVVRATGCTLLGDANGDGRSDILWRDGSGQNALWLMNGATKAVGTMLAPFGREWAAVAYADFDGDGRADIFWRNHATGANRIWYMDGNVRLWDFEMENAAPAWKVAGVGDFNGDGIADVLWRQPDTGYDALWYMSGPGTKSGEWIEWAPAVWSVGGVGDLNGDGFADIFWRRNDTGENAVWLWDGFRKSAGAWTELAGTNWHVEALADFDGDGKSDVLWRDPASGLNALWLMDGVNKREGRMLEHAPSRWSVALTNDLDGDGDADIFWRDLTTGENAVWLMKGATKTSGSFAEVAGPEWKVIH